MSTPALTHHRFNYSSTDNKDASSYDNFIALKQRVIGICTEQRTLKRKTKVKKTEKIQRLSSKSVVFVSKCPHGKTMSGGERSRHPPSPPHPWMAWSMVTMVTMAAATATMRVCCDHLEAFPFLRTSILKAGREKVTN